MNRSKKNEAASAAGQISGAGPGLEMGLRPEQEAARACFPSGLEQPPGAYRFGLEALLLACLLQAEPGALAADLGTGCGAAGLALALRCPGIRVAGVERCPELCRAAAVNARRLGLRPRAGKSGARGLPLEIYANSGPWPSPWSSFTVLRADLAAPPLADGIFDLALANPPFWQSAKGRLPKDRLRREALFDAGDSLDCFCRAAFRCLKPGGRLGLVYAAGRGNELLAALERQGLELARLVPVVTRQGRPASRLLAEAVRPGPAGGARVRPRSFFTSQRRAAPGANEGQGAPRLLPGRAGGQSPPHGTGPYYLEKSLVLHLDQEKTVSAGALAFCPFLGRKGR